MTAYKRIVSNVLKSTFLVLALVISLFIVFQVVLFLLPYGVAVQVEDKVYSQLPGIDYKAGIYHTQAEMKEIDMVKDNDQVVSWISRCVCDTKQFIFPVDSSPPHNMDSGFKCVSEPSVATAVEKQPLPAVYYRMWMLNNRLWRYRVSSDLNLSDTYRIVHHGTFFIIIIGFLTTVMVGLSSTELGKQTTRIALSIRVAALILPALGTAVAAMTAFYNPNENIPRQLQYVSGLQQLQGKIWASVWKTECPKEGGFNQLNYQIDTWEQKLQELLAVAGDTRSSAAGRGSSPYDGSNK